MKPIRTSIFAILTICICVSYSKGPAEQGPNYLPTQNVFKSHVNLTPFPTSVLAGHWKEYWSSVGSSEISEFAAIQINLKSDEISMEYSDPPGFVVSGTRFQDNILAFTVTKGSYRADYSLEMSANASQLMGKSTANTGISNNILWMRAK